MNRYPRLTVILALVGGLTLANTALFNESFAYGGTASEQKTLFGHFTLVAKDEFGKIKDYQEFDNVITDEGDRCIGNLVFVASGATCVGAIGSIGLSDCSGPGTTDAGNTACGDGVGVAITDTTTTFDETAATAPANIGDACKTGAAVTKTFTARVGATPAKVRLSATFDNTAPTFPYTAREAGILNGACSGATAGAEDLFAIKAFADVSLAGTDTLTVNYDVSYSG